MFTNTRLTYLPYADAPVCREKERERFGSIRSAYTRDSNICASECIDLSLSPFFARESRSRSILLKYPLHPMLQTNCNEYRIHYPLSFLVASYQRRQPPPLLPTTRSTSDFRAFARACISDAAIILTRLTRFRY